ncbi:MAG: S8 family serine peptidase [Chloroherpetonaceae bacterium]|nr:S8 family serine peptidase [Chloroherpetonaceae bacterium]MDW8437258.1 S8 family serine peptidase [Chloroherpetonaceae bacterium]
MKRMRLLLSLILLTLPIATSAQESAIVRLIAEKSSRSAAQQKIESNVLQKIYAMREAGLTSQNALMRNAARFNDQYGVQVDERGRIYVYLRPMPSTSFEQLESIALRNGATLGATNAEFKIVQAWVPFDKLETVAAHPAIASIQPVLRPITNVGSAISQGRDKSRANVIHSRYNVRGAGVKVGVLSDGCDGFQQSIASGDLLGVQVIDNSAGGAEGTAMMEIIQDMAPLANLAFATAFGGIAAFINNIQALADAGCKVITDDVRYFGEPVYQDGPIAQKINQVATVNDVVYTVSAGNNNLETYSTDLYVGMSPQTLTQLVGTVHNFGTQASPDDNQTFTAPAGFRVSVELQWADAFGASSNDYDLYIVDANNNTIVASGTSTQNGTQDPLEFALINAGGTYRAIVHLKSGNPVPFKIFYRSFAGTASVSLSSPAAPQVANTGGHAAATGALGCAAVDAGTTATTGSPSTIRSYSARGPVTIYNGGYPNLLEVRNKPDITSFDGARVTGNGGFPTIFEGTSASAPHVAGIAALMRSANRNLNAATVRNIIRNTAVDLGTAGVDPVFGFGRADAYSAVTSVLEGIAQYQNLNLLSIPDNDSVGVSVTLNLTGGGFVNYVALSLSTTHARLGDLVVTLQSPTGTRRTLVNRSGATTGASTAQRAHIALENLATTSIGTTQTNPNLIGYFRPAPDSFAFFGEAISGDWTVTVSDRAAGNTGALQQVGLIVNATPALFAPVFVSTPPTFAIRGVPFSYTVIAAGNPTPTLSLLNGPQGMTLNAATGALTWNPQTAPLGTYRIIIQAQNSQGVARQEFNLLLRESDWIRQTPASQMASYQINEVALAGGSDTLNIWAVGSVSLTSGPTRVMRSTNGGATWFDATGNLPNSRPAFTIGAASSQIAVVGFDNGTAYRTTNGGTTWTQVIWPPPVNTFLNRILFVSPQVGYAQGDHGPAPDLRWPVYKTTDAGATWTLTNTPNAFQQGTDIEYGQNSGMFFLNENVGWFTGVIGNSPQTSPSRVYRTTDGGNSWSFTTLPQGTAFNINIAAFNANDVFVTMQQATPTVRRSTDGGASFFNPTPGLQSIPTAIAARPNTNELYVTTSNSILKSTDNGNNWLPEPIPSTITGLNFLIFANERNGWACGANGMIVKYQPSAIPTANVGDKALDKPQSFKLAQNYPNPFNPATTIAYQLPATSDVKLEVFDVLGRKVATLVDERQSAGAYSVNFNAANLASGVYFYRLQAGSFAETKKMLLVK